MKETSQSERNISIDLIRGIAIIIVILGHALQINAENWTKSFTIEVIRSFQMPLLFFVSGMTLSFSMPINNYQIFIKKKIERLLVPYVFWCYLHYLIMTILPTDYRRFNWKTAINEVFISDFWFLRELFVFYFIVCLLSFTVNKISQKKLNNKQLLDNISVLFGVIVIIVLKKIPIICQSVNVWYYCWFLAGYFVICYYGLILQPILILTRYIKFTKKRIKFYAVILICIIFLMVLVLHKNLYLPRALFTVLYCLLISVLAFIVGTNNRSTLITKIASVGTKTLSLYAIHWCLWYSPFWRLNIYMSLPIVVWPFIIKGLVTAVVWLIISIALTELLRKSKILKRLLLGE